MAAQAPPYRPPVMVAPGVHLLQVPIRIPLRYVNCYLCQGPEGWTLVDAGFHDDLAVDAWRRAFAELGIRPEQVEQILVTHYHPDHLGAAGWLQHWTGAPVYLHEKELPLVELFWGAGMSGQLEALEELFRSEGMPADLVEGIIDVHREHYQHVLPLPTITPLATDAPFRIGTYRCRTLWTPGHSDGLAVFWAEQDGILFANDMLLATITPNVSLWPNGRPDPLRDYLESLDKVAALTPRVALPGHRAVIEDVVGRCREIREHHRHRLALMAQACRVPGGATAWEVCQQIFAPETLTVHQVRFAMSETLAHLVYLMGRGELEKRGNRYVPV